MPRIGLSLCLAYASYVCLFCSHVVHTYLYSNEAYWWVFFEPRVHYTLCCFVGRCHLIVDRAMPGRSFNARMPTYEEYAARRIWCRAGAIRGCNPDVAIAGMRHSAKDVANATTCTKTRVTSQSLTPMMTTQMRMTTGGTGYQVARWTTLEHIHHDSHLGRA